MKVEALMTLPELSEMLGVPVATLYCWRHRGEGPPGYRVGRHVRYRRAAVEAWLESRSDQHQRVAGFQLMAWIERRELTRRGRSGRLTRYQVRYRDHAAKVHSETFFRLVDAERRKAELEVELGNGTWLDPRRGQMRLGEWAALWIETRHDLRVTTWARLRTTMDRQVLPKFGSTPLVKITNGAVRAWVAEMLDAGLSAATARKAVFALRRCLAAAVADRRISANRR